MEIVFATAFGRIIDIQRGESDEMTKIANDQFQQMQEGQLTSREGLVMLISESLLCVLSLSLPTPLWLLFFNLLMFLTLL